MTYNKIRGVLELAPMRERSESFPKINKPVWKRLFHTHE